MKKSTGGKLSLLILFLFFLSCAAIDVFSPEDKVTNYIGAIYVINTKKKVHVFVESLHFIDRGHWLAEPPSVLEKIDHFYFELDKDKIHILPQQEERFQFSGSGNLIVFRGKIYSLRKGLIHRVWNGSKFVNYFPAKNDPLLKSSEIRELLDSPSTEREREIESKLAEDSNWEQLLFSNEAALTEGGAGFTWKKASYRFEVVMEDGLRYLTLKKQSEIIAEMDLNLRD